MKNFPEWKMVPSARDFEVSEAGQVRRITKPVSGPGCKRSIPYLLKAQYHKYGYPMYSIKRKLRTAHSLVAEAFLPEKPDWAECVRHVDGNPLNNHYSNLAWGTHKSNAQDCIKHGNKPNGPNAYGRGVTWDEVREIRMIYASGVQQQKGLASIYGISQQLVSRIVRGEIWAEPTQVVLGPAYQQAGRD